MRRPAFLLLFALAVATLASAQTTPASAQQIVSRWRAAVHAGKWGAPQTAVLTSTSDEDGLPGKVHEWLTTAGDYRAVVTRDFDDAEVVLTARSSSRRDWNGFLRAVEGEELSRLRTQTFESSVLAFGPPQLMTQAEVSQSDDGKLYRLKVTAPGGKPGTWYVDATTWLPVKYERPGEDSVITTTYEDWRDLGGVLTPTRGKVTETDKPEYKWERSSLKLEAGLAPKSFAPPLAGPSDVHLDAVVPPIPSSYAGARAQASERIWFNLPPARVWIYRKTQARRRRDVGGGWSEDDG